MGLSPLPVWEEADNDSPCLAGNERSSGGVQVSPGPSGGAGRPAAGGGLQGRGCVLAPAGVPLDGVGEETGAEPAQHRQAQEAVEQVLQAQEAVEQVLQTQEAVEQVLQTQEAVEQVLQAGSAA